MRHAALYSMLITVTAALVATLLGQFRAVPQTTAAEAPAPATDKLIGHMVYFSLKDKSPAARKTLVDACRKYLSDHEGTVHFSAGVLAEEFNRPVNDRDWDVALHLVFRDKAAHDKYQDHPRHQQFITENKSNWDKVRVFDALAGS